LKQVALSFILVNLLSGPGMILFSQENKPIFLNKAIWFKKSFLKTFSILPFYEYKPSINPSKTTLNLLNDLSLCEEIVDDHIQFKLTTKENQKSERGEERIRYIRLWKRKERYDSIENKISDINYIRGLTVRYETWSPRWNEKTDLAKTDLSLDEIDLLKYETKRLSKRLKRSVFRFL